MCEKMKKPVLWTACAFLSPTVELFFLLGLGGRSGGAKVMGNAPSPATALLCSRTLRSPVAVRVSRAV